MGLLQTGVCKWSCHPNVCRGSVAIRSYAADLSCSPGLIRRRVWCGGQIQCQMSHTPHLDCTTHRDTSPTDTLSACGRHGAAHVNNCMQGGLVQGSWTLAWWRSLMQWEERHSGRNAVARTCRCKACACTCHMGVGHEQHLLHVDALL